MSEGLSDRFILDPGAGLGITPATDTLFYLRHVPFKSLVDVAAHLPSPHSMSQAEIERGGGIRWGEIINLGENRRYKLSFQVRRESDAPSAKYQWFLYQIEVMV